MTRADTISLPYTLTRGRAAQLIVPILLLEPFVVAALFYALVMLSILALPLLFVGVIFVAMMAGSAVAIMVLLKQLRPAVIEINRTHIVETPLPILGFPTQPDAMHDISEFVAARIGPVSRGGVALALRRSEGSEYIVTPCINSVVARRLVVALRLPVEGECHA